MTLEQFKEIQEKIKKDLAEGKISPPTNQCYITQYKTEEELRRERINRERADWFYKTDGLSMGFHPEDSCNIF